MYTDNLSYIYVWIFDYVEKGQLYTFGDGRHAKLGLDHECYSNQYFPERSKRFSKFIVTQVSSSRVHVHQVHQGLMFMWSSSGVKCSGEFIRGWCSCEVHQRYMFMWSSSGVHVYQVHQGYMFMWSSSILKVHLNVYVNIITWKFIHIFIGSSSDVDVVLKYIRCIHFIWKFHQV